VALLPSFKNTESLTTLIHLKKKAKLNFYKPSCLRTHTPRETWKTINWQKLCWQFQFHSNYSKNCPWCLLNVSFLWRDDLIYSFQWALSTRLSQPSESWVMTGRVLPQILAARIGFLQSVLPRDKCRNTSLKERSELPCFGHVTRMTQERLVRRVLLATPTRNRPRSRPRTRWCDYISDLAWPCLGGASKTIWGCWKREIYRIVSGLLPWDLPLKKKGCEN